MTEFTELLKALPALIWALVGATVLWLVAPHVRAVIPRIQSFEGFGLKIALQALEDAVRGSPTPLAGADKGLVTDRLKREARRLDGAEILWIDDRPSGNRHEARIFQALGAHLTFAASSAEAEPLIRGGNFHLILSDINRDQKQQEGIEMLHRLRAAGVSVPVIFYTGSVQGRQAPQGSQGIADRPDALVRLVLDALADRAG